MSRVLVVDDDVLLCKSVARQIESSGYDVEFAVGFEDAVLAIDRALPDVLISDLQLGDSDGIELIRLARQRSRHGQAVLISGIATARDYQTAMRAGAIDVLCKPFSRDELIDSVNRAIECESSFAGELHGVALVEVLQMFHFSRRAVSVHVSGEVKGQVDMRDGDIVHAECGDARGEDALAVLLAGESGILRTSVLNRTEQTIDRRFDAVILDALRSHDERNRNSGGDADFELDDLDAFDLAPEPPVDSVLPQGKEDREMGKIDDCCKTVLDNTDGGIACGVVDLDTGMLLGIFNKAQYSQSLNEIVAAAAMDMFRGTNVDRIQKAVRSHRGVPEDGAHYIEEVQFTSPRNYHFCKTLKGGRAVIIMVTNKNTSLGMGWAQLKAIIPEIEPLVP